MQISPRKFNFGFELDLDSLRPNSVTLCPQERFEIFCAGINHVMTNPQDLIPLHATLRRRIKKFTDGDTSFEDMCNKLTMDSMSAHLFTDNRLRKGKLTHVWKPEHQGVHEWLKEFSYHCHGMLLWDPQEDLDFSELEPLSPKERLKYLKNWALEVLEEGATWLQSASKPLPRIEISQGVFPTRIILRIVHLVPENALFQLSIHEDRANAFTLELEWDSNTDAPLLDFGINDRIVETYAHDECTLNEGETLDSPVTYTIKIEHADPTLVAA